MEPQQDRTRALTRARAEGARVPQATMRHPSCPARLTAQSQRPESCKVTPKSTLRVAAGPHKVAPSFPVWTLRLLFREAEGEEAESVNVAAARAQQPRAKMGGEWRAETGNETRPGPKELDGLSLVCGDDRLHLARPSLRKLQRSSHSVACQGTPRRCDPPRPIRSR